MKKEIRQVDANVQTIMIPKEICKEAKLLSIEHNMKLWQYIAEAVKEKNERIKKKSKK